MPIFSHTLSKVSTYKLSPCKDATTPSTQDDSYCAFVGWSFVYLFIVAVAWFACVSINIFLSLMRWSWFTSNLMYFRIGCYVMCWGVPWIPAIVVLSLKKIEGGSLTCLVAPSHIDGNTMLKGICTRIYAHANIQTLARTHTRTAQHTQTHRTHAHVRAHAHSHTHARRP